MNHNVTDDGETQEINCHCFQVSGKSEHTQYIKPAFQKENGKFMPWLETAIPTVEDSEGNTMAATL